MKEFKWITVEGHHGDSKRRPSLFLLCFNCTNPGNGHFLCLLCWTFCRPITLSISLYIEDLFTTWLTYFIVPLNPQILTLWPRDPSLIPLRSLCGSLILTSSTGEGPGWDTTHWASPSLKNLTHGMNEISGVDSRPGRKSYGSKQRPRKGFV